MSLQMQHYCTVFLISKFPSQMLDFTKCYNNTQKSINILSTPHPNEILIEIDSKFHISNGQTTSFTCDSDQLTLNFFVGNLAGINNQ